SALGVLHEPPYAERHVRWCGRLGAVRPPAYPIKDIEASDTTLDIRDADATQITVSSPKLIETGGEFATFSRDSKNILYTKLDVDKRSFTPSRVFGNRNIYVMNNNGTNKRLIIKNGFNGVWSPMGDRIAYCSQEYGTDQRNIQKWLDVLTILDTKTKKKYRITQVDDCYVSKIDWSADGKYIYYRHTMTPSDIGKSGIRVDLDNLNVEKVDKITSDQEWTFSSIHPKVWFFEGYANNIQGIHGIWVKNKKIENIPYFERLLIPLTLNRFKMFMSSDLKTLLYEGGGDIWWPGNIYTVNVSTLKIPTRTIFKADIGKNLLLQYWKDNWPGPEPQRVTPEEKIDAIAKNGEIWGKIKSQKVNPLNNKVVGPGQLSFQY
ncbi:MAG: hypothetical protein M1377_03285, partial [Deltaproteobacteria bacterium]|nr:hypothetical protein [Deltaproteobacteria bacterium]